MRWTLPVLCVGVVLSLTGAAAGRTITLTADDCDRIAIISEKAPRLSWAHVQEPAGVYDTGRELHMYGHKAILIRFPIEKVPAGQRITKAVLTLRALHVDGAPKVHVRRILTSWGPGVCHLYRQTVPTKLEWAQPGGRAGARDRAEKSGAIFDFSTAGVKTEDVTEDVELWYTAATANHGWIMQPDSDVRVLMPSIYNPQYGHGKEWKLQITYEPK